MKAIKIIKCGTMVTTVIGKIQGQITGVNIRFDRIQYEISYYNNGEIQTQWMNENEFNCNQSTKQTLGYL